MQQAFKSCFSMLQSKKEQVVVVERRGPDATWLLNVYHAHRWGKDVVNLVD
ncbi:hypothetical protein HanPI659440_Chr02g0083121 [Helianthus annuus]|nr:hypothetical protein HanPI659440_Chr02g0083121 [Helianthus annuus]